MSAYPPEWEQYVVADQDGIPRMCGAVPRSLPCGVLVPEWYSTNETCPAIPRDQWKSTPDMRPYEWNNRYQNGYPSCFPPGTLVRMGDGTQKPIQEIKVLDEVLTAEGEVHPVTATMARRHTGDLVRLVCWGHSHLRATPEHPILTKRGYVNASELVRGDYVAVPKYLPQTCLWTMTAEKMNLGYHVRQTKRTSWRRSPQNRGVATWVTTTVPDVIHFDRSFGRLLGLFIAEGCTHHGSVVWTFNANERDTLAAEVVSILHDSLGAEATVRTRGKNTCYVTLHGTAWAKLFEELCGNGAGEKRLHPELCSAPVEFLEGMYTGWHDGDKGSSKNTVTISRMLSMNMFDVASGLGWSPSVRVHSKERTSPDGVHHRESYSVEAFPNGRAPKLGSKRFVYEDACAWHKVRYLESTPYDGYVFNLEVANRNSYVAEGIGVHNCCLNSFSGCVEFIMGRDNRKRQACDWHKFWVEVTGGRGGAAVDAACQYAMTKGIPLKDGSGRIKITEAWDVPTLDAIASGLQAGAFAVTCHDVHAECTVGLVMQGTTAYVQMVNSHYEGANAANNWHTFPLSRIELSTYGAMLIREIEFVPADGLIDAKG
jgi:hypothetical protein